MLYFSLLTKNYKFSQKNTKIFVMLTTVAKTWKEKDGFFPSRTCTPPHERERWNSARQPCCPFIHKNSYFFLFSFFEFLKRIRGDRKYSKDMFSINFRNKGWKGKDHHDHSANASLRPARPGGGVVRLRYKTSGVLLGCYQRLTLRLRRSAQINPNLNLEKLTRNHGRP